MTFTFPEWYMAQEFIADLKRAGIIAVLSADKLSVTVAISKTRDAARILHDACGAQL